MPILIVPSHHHSPKDLENMDEYIGPYGKGISAISPEKVIYETREGDRRLGTEGIMVASQEALTKILASPEDAFRGYEFRVDTIRYGVKSRKFQTEYLPDEKLTDASEKDQSNPNRRSLTHGWTEGFSGVALIQKNDAYHRAMTALMDVIGKLPILPVLQAYVFNPKYFTRFHAKNMRDETINHEEFKIKYPEGVLAYPKRVWPEFYSLASGKSLLRVSHHPNRDNDPHYFGFATDPRLGEVTKEDDVTSIITKLKTYLLPFLEKELETDQKNFYKDNPGLEEFDRKIKN